ncbi:MAG: carboxylesterase family protein [Cyclobacteriaceae bacterium]|nr:carboxylesterase family protein [Cyclobacteriaceae bacterium]
MFVKHLIQGIFVLICSFLLSSNSIAQQINESDPFFSKSLNGQSLQTFTYFQRDTVQLEMDVFMPDQILSDEKVPLLIFVHGGGFSGGSRDAGYNLGKFMAERGIAVSTISYSLYMKGQSFSCQKVLSEKVKAIQIAANQLWRATHFLIEKSAELPIDTEKIFISGSSAGAETVLHAAFWDQKLMNLYNEALPANFKYAGLISGAGAIMDLNLITETTQIPVMLFHGEADPLVPYKTAAHHFCPPDSPGWLMLFGSYSIFEHFQKIDGTVKLISYKEGKHDIAGAHFFQNQEPVYDFIQKVLEGEKFQNHVKR